MQEVVQTEEPFLFPKCLHGTRAATRSAWRRIARRAWQNGGWVDVLARLGMHPVSFLSGDIVLMRRADNSPRDAAWRMHWVNDLLPEVMPHPFTDSSLHAFHHMTLEGMERLWYTVGMLCPNGAISPGLGLPRRQLVDEFLRPALERFVHWLPEIVLLSPRFAACLPTSLGVHLPHLQLMWASKILFLCGELGCSISITDIQLRYDSDVIAALLNEGIIERAGARYRLRL